MSSDKMRTIEDTSEDWEITQTGEAVDHSMCTEYYQPQREEILRSGEGEAIDGSISNREIPRTGERSLSSVSSKYQTDKNQLIGRPWSTGFFDCHENETNAIMTAFLPCFTFGRIAEVVDGGEMVCHWVVFSYLIMMPALCSQWLMGSLYRKKLREKYGLVEASYTDVISHIFCPFCSLCQEFRELKIRGLDPALGWKGILAQQQGQGEEYKDGTLGLPPQIQAMSK